jgi:hypothetical protein
MPQKTFSPLDNGFRWTGLDSGDLSKIWYEYDGKPAEKAALQARNAFAKKLEKEGFRVRKISLGKQLVSRGGIGSGRPHIELVVPVYMVDWS